jgi:hypothetical protein
MSFWLRVSAGLTLVALALMTWSLIQPTPLPVMLAMTVGQGIGTAAFAAFGWVVFRDLSRKRAERRESQRSMQLEAVRRSQELLWLEPAPAPDAADPAEDEA